MAGPDHQPVAPAEQTLRFLDRCRQRLDEVADNDKAREGTDVLGAAITMARSGAGERQPWTPSWLPVLDSIEELAAAGSRDGSGVSPDVSDLTPDLLDLANSLPWVPTHRATDGGTELALAPLDRVLGVGDTIIGLMYVGPNATYPLHQHPPQELYLTIAGHGRWRYGGNDDFEDVGPDRTLYNHPGDLHSAVAGSLPVVALYVLW